MKTQVLEHGIVKTENTRRPFRTMINGRLTSFSTFERARKAQKQAEQERLDFVIAVQKGA